MLASCAISVLSRSSLNIIDRYLYGRQPLHFRFLYFTSISLPFLYALIPLLLMGNLMEAARAFFSTNCFLLALATNLVGLSFSNAFRYKDVRHVVLYSKIPELLLPIVLTLPFFSGMWQGALHSWKNFIPLGVTWISFIPYFLNGKYKGIFFDRAAFYLCSSLLFQMVVASTIALSLSSLAEILSYTAALLLWRCILSLLMPFKRSDQQPTSYKTLPRSVLGWIGIRGIIGLSTQLTFNWAISEGNPLIVWPLLNTTVIISSVASQFFLKEKIHRSDWVALLGIFAGTSLTQWI